MLGRGVVPADTPVLPATDLGVVRGDGVFETMHVRAGRAWLRDEHLARMATSASRVQLNLPGPDALGELVEAVCEQWPAQREGALRVVCTRGSEDGGHPVTFATLAPVADAVRATRRTGVSVVTAGLGVPATARPEMPWLLGGVKSLSYAVNLASLRWAAQRGADDLLWVSTDGYALEAPTSSLVWLAGGTLWTVPPAETGILPGITAGWLLDHAEQLGYRSGTRLVRPTELATADGVWLTSSVRGVVAVRTLDGVPMPDHRVTAALQKLLGFPT